MGTVAVIGEPGLVGGYALAGALVVPAADAAEARRAWRELPESVAMVILTAAAARAVTDEARRTGPLSVVMPE
ncbi:V-type ATP synthase subunit F [Mycolicibacterium palauense]|uniref:V-type ATP synthase subunit F n=1 Tax=Mycolicibacterium palauense TaxID=2034511 RepID=UPI000BFEDAE1|nr:V-type ATP synthase subunit F [Mycolicibacterium palauense]